MDEPFETEHLRIIKFTLSDSKTLYEIHAEENFQKWIPKRMDD